MMEIFCHKIFKLLLIYIYKPEILLICVLNIVYIIVFLIKLQLKYLKFNNIFI